MNILFSVLTKGWGGLEKYPFSIYDYLVESGHKIIFLTIKGTRIHEECIKRNIPVVTINEYKKYSYSIIKEIGNIIKNYNIDIVHSNKTGELYNWSIALRKYPKTGYIISAHMGIIPKKKRFSSVFYKRVDKYITISKHEYNKSLIYLPIRQDKVVLLHHGINFKEIDEQKPADLKKELNISGNGKIILAAGNMTKDKGIVEFLEAGKILSKIDSNIYFVWAGDSSRVKDSDAMSKAKNFINENNLNNRIFLIGYRNDLYSILKSSDVFLHPSYYETFGYVYLEAMYAGKPVIAVNTGIIPEMEKEFGAVISKNNIEELVDAVQTVLQNIKSNESYYLKNRESAEPFSIEKHIKELCRIYEEAYRSRNEK